MSLSQFWAVPLWRGNSPSPRSGWHALKFHQTLQDDYALDFGGLDPKTGSEWPVMAVFKKSGRGANAKVRLFWKGEMTGEMADPGKDHAAALIPRPCGLCLISRRKGVATNGTRCSTAEELALNEEWGAAHVRNGSNAVPCYAPNLSHSLRTPPTP